VTALTTQSAVTTVPKREAAVTAQKVYRVRRSAGDAGSAPLIALETVTRLEDSEPGFYFSNSHGELLSSELNSGLMLLE